MQWELKATQQKISHHDGQVGILDRHDWFDTNETCKKCSFLTGAFESRKIVQEEERLQKALEEDIEDIEDVEEAEESSSEPDAPDQDNENNEGS